MKVRSNVKKFFAVCTTVLTLASYTTRAATLEVDKADPACSDVTGAPYCSIQAAVTAASDGDTITIGAGTYLENVVAADKDLSLIGDGVGSTIVDGNAMGPVFYFTSASLLDIQVSSMTIRDGKTAVHGGAIYMFKGNLEVSDCEILNSEASTGYGGGVYFEEGDLSVTDCTIAYNDAPTGGGGGIHLASGDLTIASSSLHDNTSDILGGGISHLTGTLSLTDTTVYNNMTNTNGGGIYHVTGSVTLTGSTVSDNSAVQAGGVYHTSGSMTLNDSAIDDNFATAANFGGLYAGVGSSLTLNGSSVSGNYAASSAGGLYHDGTLTMSNSQVDDNTAAAGLGGGIYHNTGAVSITGSSVSGNAAVSGGGLIQASGALTIVDSFIDDNAATVSLVGGIYHATGDLIIEDSSVSGNYSFTHVGGIYHGGPALRLIASTVADNSAGGSVGGIYAVNGITGVNSTISANTADATAGGLYTAGTTTLHNMTLTGNSADANHDGVGDVGGVYNVGVSLTLRNTIIAGNSDFGGEIPDCGGTLTSAGYNLIGDPNGCTFTPVAGDQVGTHADPLAAGLEPLSDNGGPTFTHALAVGSLALDAGNPSGCEDENGDELTVDQRGAARPQGTACDIGAYEADQCGDGIVAEDEACDDGGLSDGDGCSAVCQVEAVADDDAGGDDVGDDAAVDTDDDTALAADPDDKIDDVAGDQDDAANQDNTGNTGGSTNSGGSGGCSLAVPTASSSANLPWMGLAGLVVFSLTLMGMRRGWLRRHS